MTSDQLEQALLERIPSLDLLLDTTTVIPLTRGLSAALRWVVAGSRGEVRDRIEAEPAGDQLAMDMPPSMPTI